MLIKKNLNVKTMDSFKLCFIIYLYINYKTNKTSIIIIVKLLSKTAARVI